MTARDAVGATREAVAALAAAVGRLRDEYGDTLGVRRISSDLDRFHADLDEIGEPDPTHRPGARGGVPSGELEEISDEPYDESMWGPDAESESTHAH